MCAINQPSVNALLATSPGIVAKSVQGRTGKEEMNMGHRTK